MNHNYKLDKKKSDESNNRLMRCFFGYSTNNKSMPFSSYS